MAKKDAVEQLKKRIVKLQEERDEAVEGNLQIQIALNAILREVVKNFGEDGKLVLPPPNLLEKGKVAASKTEEGYLLELKEEGDDEKQVGESRPAEA